MQIRKQKPPAKIPREIILHRVKNEGFLPDGWLSLSGDFYILGRERKVMYDLGLFEGDQPKDAYLNLLGLGWIRSKKGRLEWWTPPNHAQIRILREYGKTKYIWVNGRRITWQEFNQLLGRP